MNAKSFFGGVIVSHEADAVARELIHDFQIPKSYNLAFLLKVNKCFDDHQVLRLWIQRLLDDGLATLEDLNQQARLQLLSLIPQ